MLQSRVYYPSERTCPPHVLAGCRLVDPAAELLYAGRGRWLLGVVRFGWPAYQVAWQTLDKLAHTATLLPRYGSDAEKLLVLEQRARGNAEKRAYYRLALQGYRHIAVYEVRDPDSAIVHDFQFRDLVDRLFRDLELHRVLEQALAAEDHQTLARIEKLRGLVRTHGADTYRFAGALRKHFPTIGSKGAAA